MVCVVGAVLLTACSADGPVPPEAAPITSATTASPSPASPGSAAPPVPASVWVTNEMGRTLSRVDATGERVLAQHQTPGRPHNVAVGSGGVVAATLPGEGLLYLLDPAVGGRAVDLGGQPHDVKPVGARFVVANEGAAALQTLERDGSPVANIALPAQPHDLAIAPDGRTAWVSLDGSDQLAVVDLERAEVRRLVPTGASPHDLLFSPTGELWVTDWNGPVAVYSAGGELRKRVELGPQSHHLAFTPDGAQAWITDNSANRVFVVDADRLGVVTTVETPGAPHHVTIAAGRAVVADGTGLAVLYDIGTQQEAGRVPTGDDPHGVATAL